MLTVKSFVVLAAAAFAVAQVDAAAQATHIKISIHKQAAPCKDGFREVSVEGVAGVFCAKDKICVADVKDGNCPTEAAPGMPYGAYCDVVKTGVYGCKPVTEDMLEDSEESEEDDDECGEGESPMSVEGVEGVFCVAGKACVADIKDGACPGKQDGLPYGSYCDKVKTGVYGCKPSKPSLRAKSHNKTHHKQAAPCKAGFREVSVEGVAGVFCAKDQICAGSIFGNCPTESAPGMPQGAECGKVKTGVYGCKPKGKTMAHKSHHKQVAPCKPGFREVSVEGVAGVFCAKDQICAGSIMGNCPTEAGPGLQYGAYCGKVKTGVYGCKPKTQWMARKSHQKAAVKAGKCAAGMTEVSVEGVEGVFCAKDKICVADYADGNCPTEAAPGMPYGAYCDVVKTGVYGCKPVTEDMLEDSEESEESEECGEGESPMSVEGVEGVFCVAGKACVADIKDGACPGKQDGLPNGSHCGKVKTGVYGCKPN